MALVIMSIQRVTADLPRALQLVSVIKRCIGSCKAKTASADELQSLWDPPGIQIALQMSQWYWTSVCLASPPPVARDHTQQRPRTRLRGRNHAC